MLRSGPSAHPCRPPASIQGDDKGGRDGIRSRLIVRVSQCDAGQQPGHRRVQGGVALGDLEYVGEGASGCGRGWSHDQVVAITLAVEDAIGRDPGVQEGGRRQRGLDPGEVVVRNAVAGIDQRPQRRACRRPLGARSAVPAVGAGEVGRGGREEGVDLGLDPGRFVPRVAESLAGALLGCDPGGLGRIVPVCPNRIVEGRVAHVRPR